MLLCAPNSHRISSGHLSNDPFKLLSHSALSFLFLSFQTQASLFTPCNYPVPNESTFQVRCGTNYLHSTYICDVDKQISLTAVEKINSILTKYELFTNGYVRVGIAVLRVLEFPNWDNINSPETASASSISYWQHVEEPTPIPNEIIDPSDKFYPGRKMDSGKLRRHTSDENLDNGDDKENPNWHCLSQAQINMYKNLYSEGRINISSIIDYLQLFADLLRKRWFGGECNVDVFFLAVTQSIIDQSTGRVLLQLPLIRISMSPELSRVLPLDYGRELQNELSSLSDKRWSPELMIGFAIQRIAHSVNFRKVVDRKIPVVLVDAGGKHQIVTAVVLKHNIPPWAIYTFIGCLGSVGLALSLEWSIVRRKALSIRGNGKSGGGPERQRTSKSDNVQVHLYF